MLPTTEIVAHLICKRLEADPSLVVGKVDCKNAFNAIHMEPILDVIRDELPILLPFAELLLSMAPIYTVPSTITIELKTPLCTL